MSCAPAIPRHVPPADPKPAAPLPAVDPKPKPKKDAVKPPHATPEWFAEEERIFVDSLLRVERIEFEDLSDDPSVITGPAKVDPSAPVTGGRARIFIQRGFLDDIVAEMIRAAPFGARGIFIVTDSTHRRLELTLPGDLRRANGRRVTSLDFIELWSRFMKARPAQGLAMFRNVQGAQEFIAGQDPLVRGFNAADERTIQIRFTAPDPLAFHRLNSTKLIGGPFMLGAYYSGGTSGTEMRLLPNANSMFETAFLTECVIQMGGDMSAITSFAFGQYSAMTLYAASDLDIARTELMNDATLHRLPADRYFLSCRHENEQARRFVRNSVNGGDILKNVVKGEGMEIHSVAVREAAATPRTNVSVPQLSRPFRIIYREDDPISTAVAEKISADLRSAGMAAEIIGKNAESYEVALVRREYDGAVGWVSEAVLDDITEQLHLASMWFADETDSQVRLRNSMEIPLFSVDNYLLFRDDVKLHGGRLSGIWISKP